MYTDMCLGMMKNILRMRPDMKLVVIASATLDPDLFLNYFAEFGAQKLEIRGRQFPIRVHYEPPKSDSAG
ncbi:unnamed protein product [Gongylonema pulchrum]|uniref:Response regulatory domain-containing protein n=1 Tax=Gongylonema pulchrum TaxID=637853 RepID=A0A183DSQ3_9BILA|nr:unnamed protein product [Gongylonema pulchrum]